MTITEAFKKSPYVTHPNINGVVAAYHGEWLDGFVQIYLDDKRHKYHSNTFTFTLDLLTSEEWVPVSMKIDITELT